MSSLVRTILIFLLDMQAARRGTCTRVSHLDPPNLISREVFYSLLDKTKDAVKYSTMQRAATGTATTNDWVKMPTVLRLRNPDAQAAQGSKADLI